jgi:hypothetical protein
MVFYQKYGSETVMKADNLIAIKKKKMEFISNALKVLVLFGR